MFVVRCSDLRAPSSIHDLPSLLSDRLTEILDGGGDEASEAYESLPESWALADERMESEEYGFHLIPFHLVDQSVLACLLMEFHPGGVTVSPGFVVFIDESSEAGFSRAVELAKSAIDTRIYSLSVEIGYELQSVDLTAAEFDLVRKGRSLQKTVVGHYEGSAFEYEFNFNNPSHGYSLVVSHDDGQDLLGEWSDEDWIVHYAISPDLTFSSDRYGRN